MRLGLAPAVISPFVLEKMAWSSATEKMLTGRTFTAEEALRSGLLQFVGNETELNQFIENTLQSLMKVGPEAVRATKNLLAEVKGKSWYECKEATVKVIAERRVSEEGQEGLRAFFEKRRPAWSGDQP